MEVKTYPESVQNRPEGATNSGSVGLQTELREIPFVTVIIPCRNEERYISRCLDSLLGNDYPQEYLEILVLDGRSEDRTRVIVADYARQYDFIRLIDNPARSIPAAMNTGIHAARGEVVLKMDAHSLYDPRHISACVQALRQYGAENTGGIWHMVPGANTSIARAIVFALRSRFGSGNAKTKTGTSTRDPVWADSVAFGCFRKEFLVRVGMYDERLLGSSDMDLNRRIAKAGGRILLLPSVVVEYFADATLKGFVRHNFADGVWVAYVLKYRSRAWSLRHWVPFAFVSTLLATLLLSVVWHHWLYPFLAILGCYCAGTLLTSAETAWNERSAELMLLLPPVFGLRHFCHGLGTMYGLALLLVPGVHWKGRRSAKG